MTNNEARSSDSASDLDELLRLNPAMTRLQARTYMMVEAVLEQNGVPASLSWDGCKYVDDYLAEVEAENRAYGEQQRREGRNELAEASSIAESARLNGLQEIADLRAALEKVLPWVAMISRMEIGQVFAWNGTAQVDCQRDLDAARAALKEPQGDRCDWCGTVHPMTLLDCPKYGGPELDAIRSQRKR